MICNLTQLWIVLPPEPIPRTDGRVNRSCGSEQGELEGHGPDRGGASRLVRRTTPRTSAVGQWMETEYKIRKIHYPAMQPSYNSRLSPAKSAGVSRIGPDRGCARVGSELSRH